ncbi:MAG TPA: ABC transporter ATP-binding protein [Marmoricola sp.]|nr:ABC transporter ATP-binding protein [Marmoricola sp.]
MTPRLAVSVDVPGRLRAELGARAGERIALVGPNGAGKTSMLRAIAGTAPGRTTWAGRDWTGRPPYQRPVGLVHQDHQLFPHLSVLENVAFGPRAAGAPRRRARDLARSWLERVGLAEYAARRPTELSGGQAQRVAIARALASEPEVLLLDEPFAALDVGLAIELRDLLAEHLRERPDRLVLLATHEALDVHALAERVVVLEHGEVVQDADPATVAESPATGHAARLLGLNVLRGTATGDGTVVLADGGAVHTGDRHLGPVLAAFAPSTITLTRERPTGSARNAWRARVLGVAAGSDDRAGVGRVHLHVPALGRHDLRADITLTSAASLGVERGAEVWASVKATEVSVFAGPAGQPPPRAVPPAPADR